MSRNRRARRDAVFLIANRWVGRPEESVETPRGPATDRRTHELIGCLARLRIAPYVAGSRPQLGCAVRRDRPRRSSRRCESSATPN